MRRERPLIVQTSSQYVFLHQLLVDYIVSRVSLACLLKGASQLALIALNFVIEAPRCCLPPTPTPFV
jgi:hypothetical protein